MPTIQGILETALHVSDIQRSARFYEELFGFSRLVDDAHFIALSVPGKQILLLFTEGVDNGGETPFGYIPAHDGHGTLHLAFTISAEDVTAWEEKLTLHGIAIESRVYPERGGISLYFRDPDRHVVELTMPCIWYGDATDRESVFVCERQGNLRHIGERYSMETIIKNPLEETTNGAATMQALVFTDFKRNQLQAVPAPRLEKPDDALVQIRAVGVCGSDLHGYTGQSGRRTPPMVMGHEAAGVVLEVGAEVTHLKPGDRVAIQPVRFCGACVFCQGGKSSLCTNRLVLGVHSQAGGAYAEKIVVPGRSLHPIPDHLSFAAAAFAEPVAVCLHALKLVDFKPYDSVALVGSGPIGLLTLVILRTLGLRQIFVSDLNDDRLGVAKSLGATITINPSRDNARAIVDSHTNGLGADITIEAVGVGASAQAAVDLCKNGGTVLWIGNNVKQIQIDMQAIVTRELRVQGSYAMNDLDFATALAMLADCAIDTVPLLSRRTSLAQSEPLFDELIADQSVIKCVIEVGE